MKAISGKTARASVEIREIIQNELFGEEIRLSGSVHSLKKMSGFYFLTLRKRDGVVQCIVPDGALPDALKEECAVTVTGVARKEPRAKGGFEVDVSRIEILSAPKEHMPVAINKARISIGIDAELPLRPVVLRNLRRRSVFKLQEAISRGFREFLTGQDFTEIHTPKITAKGAEGGSNIFKLDYFGKKACLAQSPQFYKQIMTGVFERVFEVAPVFRAEKHSTARHLSEYTSLDFEMAFIDSFEDIMEMETAMLRYIFDLMRSEYEEDIERLSINVPEVDSIPSVRFDEAKRLAAEKYQRSIRDPYDLEPEEEQLIGRYFKEEYGSDFVFITHYPEKKRPFYAMNDPEDERYTLSFDLLFRGMEVTTGGQRIHDYDTQINKLLARGMQPDEIEYYLMIHKHGIPPHGGLGLGLERLTMRLTDETNVRCASLFPRDLSRITP